MSGPVNAAEPIHSMQSVMVQEKLAATKVFDTVSKRSVERYYHPSEPQYLRHFVKKPQRRSPLLNRIFWLRLKAIEQVVLTFLSTHAKEAPKLVINLGCGSDVLPWTMYCRHKDACSSTCFIDVDFPSTMKSKRDTVLRTPALQQLVGSDHRSSDQESDPLFLASKKYCQIGCDFTDIDTLRSVIEPLADKGTQVLVVAEMSLIFNDVVATDRLIEWANNELHAEVCLLEHCLPGGGSHPFAAKLLRDYQKDQTPLKGLYSYQTASSQIRRFQKRGWSSVNAYDLWEFWTKIDDTERELIHKIDPFDDWEDLILLTRHLLVLHARNGVQQAPVPGPESAVLKPTKIDAQISCHPLTKNPKRRFGALMQDTTTEGAELLISLMGQDTNGLSDNYDALTFSQGEIITYLPASGPSSRSCFTITDLGHAGVLVIGGRSTALDRPLSDCWLYVRGRRPHWKKTWDMPAGLYRHSAIRLGQSSMALVLGGRSAGSVSSSAYVYHPDNGWRICVDENPVKPALFGAAAWNVNEPDAQSSVGKFQGLVCGGLTGIGNPNLEVYRWYLDTTGVQARVRFETLPMDLKHSSNSALFGTCVTTTDTHVILAGGIGTGSHTGYLGQSLVQWPLTAKELSAHSKCLLCLTTGAEWPVMLGSSAVVYRDHLIIVGGGNAGYQSNTLWTEGLYAIKINTNSPVSDLNGIRLMESPRMTTAPEDVDVDVSTNNAIVPLTIIPRMHLNSPEDFRSVLENRKPAILEGLDFGPCLTKWTPQYLCDQVGSDTQVTVHESISDSPRLDFNSKNFRYVTDSFGNIIDKMERGGRMYLRALSRSKPSDIPANLNDDFPFLAPDFRLPPELSFASDCLFSSILRLSGRANMWLHYDVMANIYTQVRGTKKMILFPPRDATRLAFAPGASSSSLDVFSALGTEALAGTHPYEANLGEGDALFLPAAWLHTAAPLTDMSVAVNVFFRDLSSGYAEGRDVYGNRDLSAYEKGRQDVAKIAQAFRNVPQDMRQFYLSRIAEELRQLAESR